MSKRVKLFEPCYMEYKGIDKPVQYTEEFLSELASKVNETNLVDNEHFGDAIGSVMNFTVNDGVLWGDVTSSKALDDLKYSPYFECDLQDTGDVWLAINPKGLVDVALTSKPRQPVKLPNTNNGGSTMAEGKRTENETIKILNNQVKDLNKELAIANNKLKTYEEKNKQFDEMEKELKELESWKETNEKVIEEQKPIIKAYKKDLETKKSELLEKISNGNEEVKNQLKDLPIESLETIDNLHSNEQPPQGISAGNAQGLDEGDGSNDGEAEQQKRQEAVKGMFSDLFKEE